MLPVLVEMTLEVLCCRPLPQAEPLCGQQEVLFTCSSSQLQITLAAGKGIGSIRNENRRAVILL